ncbi:cytochrome P450 [Streptomyces glaucus]|uniref:Cytochrome P450 n=1 Tax=Streptomyces glaucus TaxID=284029 RepID=A0ABN3JQM0_9ACTN
MTPEHHVPTGTDDALLAPPPGCPAHGLGPGGLHRLHETEDLPQLYEELRAEHGPVAPALIHDDVPLWVVLGLAENLQMVSTPARFCRDSRIWTPLRQGRIRPGHPYLPHIAWQPICAHAEGDEHKRLRGAVTGAISTIDHRTLRRHINRHTQRLVNRFCEGGRADLVGQFAEHLPMAVMCELLGMPDEYGDRLVEAARDMLEGTSTAIAGNAYIMDALARLTARRRARPDEDLTSYLLNHPARLTDDEVREHLRVILIAAYETTANLVANVLRMVLTDPGIRARLSGGQTTVPQAVEQSLWDEPPFSTVFAYFAKQDTELGGKLIRKGDGLLFGIAPGNVDPRVRPDLSADMMGNRSHLAFGGGPHECPGQDIGRAIAGTGVDALLMRLPDIRLDCAEDELRRRSSIVSRHLVELPVWFEPRPQRDIRERPPHATIPPRPARYADFEKPASEPAAARPRPEPVIPSWPRPDPAAPPQPEPARPQGARQRLVRWWRGY